MRGRKEAFNDFCEAQLSLATRQKRIFEIEFENGTIEDAVLLEKDKAKTKELTTRQAPLIEEWANEKKKEIDLLAKIECLRYEIECLCFE